jgi:acyl carrier protein
MASREELTETIIHVIQEILAQKGTPPTALTLDSNIESLGLESLDWAAVVVLLEEKTQVDPFQRGFGQDLHTLGDLVDVYISEMNPSIRRELDEAVQ